MSGFGSQRAGGAGNINDNGNIIRQPSSAANLTPRMVTDMSAIMQSPMNYNVNDIDMQAEEDDEDANTSSALGSSYDDPNTSYGYSQAQASPTNSVSAGYARGNAHSAEDGRFHVSEYASNYSSASAVATPSKVKKPMKVKVKKEHADSRTGEDDEEINIDEVVQTDVTRIPVKVLRKAIPKLRISCYKGLDVTAGKKKFKHLWDDKPEDWPADIPFKDPNNAVKDKDGQIVQVKKPGKEELRPMFEFLRDKYRALQSAQQPSDGIAENGASYRGVPVVAESTDDGEQYLLMSGSNTILAIKNSSFRSMSQHPTSVMSQSSDDFKFFMNQHQPSLMGPSTGHYQSNPFANFSSAMPNTVIKTEAQSYDTRPDVESDRAPVSVTQHQFNAGSHVVMDMNRSGQTNMQSLNGGRGNGVNNSENIPVPVRELYDRLKSKQAAVRKMSNNSLQVDDILNRVDREIIQGLYKLSEDDKEPCSRLMFLDAGHQLEALLDVMTVLEQIDLQLLSNGCSEIIHKFKSETVTGMVRPVLDDGAIAALIRRLQIQGSFDSKKMQNNDPLSLIGYEATDKLHAILDTNTPSNCTSNVFGRVQPRSGQEMFVGSGDQRCLLKVGSGDVGENRQQHNNAALDSDWLGRVVKNKSTTNNTTDLFNLVSQAIEERVPCTGNGAGDVNDDSNKMEEDDLKVYAEFDVETQQRLLDFWELPISREYDDRQSDSVTTQQQQQQQQQYQQQQHQLRQPIISSSAMSTTLNSTLFDSSSYSPASNIHENTTMTAAYNHSSSWSSPQCPSSSSHASTHFSSTLSCPDYRSLPHHRFSSQVSDAAYSSANNTSASSEYGSLSYTHASSGYSSGLFSPTTDTQELDLQAYSPSNTDCNAVVTVECGPAAVPGSSAACVLSNYTSFNPFRDQSFVQSASSFGGQDIQAPSYSSSATLSSYYAQPSDSSLMMSETDPNLSTTAECDVRVSHDDDMLNDIEDVISKYPADTRQRLTGSTNQQQDYVQADRRHGQESCGGMSHLVTSASHIGESSSYSFGNNIETIGRTGGTGGGASNIPIFVTDMDVSDPEDGGSGSKRRSSKGTGKKIHRDYGGKK